MNDRTVHAAYDGIEVVRYDRAGKWYLEPTDPTLKRQQVSIADAVAAARWGKRYANGQIHLGRCGGSRFDSLVQQEQRINVTGRQGTRIYLRDRDVSFPVHNPTVSEIRAKISALHARRPGRGAGQRAAKEAADLLQTLLDRET